MKNEKYISPDELFRENLNGMEAPYDEAAWKGMADLLDKAEAKRPFFWWFHKNKKYTLITLISTTMLTTTIFMLLNMNMNANKNLNAGSIVEKTNNESKNINEGFTAKNNAGINSNADLNANNTTHYYAAKSNEVKTESTDKNATSSNENGNVETPYAEINNGPFETISTSPVIEPENTVESPTIVASKEPEKANTDAVITTSNVGQSNTDIAKVASTVAPNQSITSTKKCKTYPPLMAKKDYDKYDGPFNGVWLGLHFALQYPQNPLLQDSWRQNAGFNFQLMSHNLTGRRDFGGYLGFDLGAQWTGRSNKSNVVLDNSTLDSGFTRLSNFSIDFFARGHFEYTKFRLKPYVNVFAGPRFFGTNQYTETYKHRVDVENSSSNSAYSAVSLMYGAGVGVRYRLGSVVSFDIRYDIMQGTETNLVNLDKSTFNGLGYNLSKFKVTPQYSQLKFGFLFDLEEEEITHKDEVEEVTEYYKYDSTTQNFIKVQCNCKQWPVNNQNSGDSIVVIKNRGGYGTPSRGGFNNGGGGYRPSGSFPSGSGSSGGSRGGMPGIKSGGGGLKPKS